MKRPRPRGNCVSSSITSDCQSRSPPRGGPARLRVRLPLASIDRRLSLPFRVLRPRPAMNEVARDALNSTTSHPAVRALVLNGALPGDEMLGPDGAVSTQHSLNKVPFVVAGEAFRGATNALQEGDFGLADIAPTVLDLLGLPQPVEMTGRTILANRSE